MEAKHYKLPVLLDLCGGSPQAMRALLPLYALKDDGLWLDREAIAAHMALPADRDWIKGSSPDPDLLDLLDDLWRRAEEAGLTWHPRENTGLPALPVPFSAHELAAFMLAGGGRSLYDRYGGDVHLPPGVAQSEWRGTEQGHFRISEQQVLEACSRRGQHSAPVELGDNADMAREVLEEVIVLLRAAEDRFERDDAGVRQAADWLLSAQERIEPEPTDPPRAGAPSPAPLTTVQMAEAFDGLRYPAGKWRKPLGNLPKWLIPSMVGRGSRGVRERTWNPVLLGAALVHKGYAKPRTVRARFQTNPLLATWQEQWKTYEADNFAAD